MDWKAEFNGRQKGAIGIFHPVVCMVTADSRDKAIIRLYDNWECITDLKLEPAIYELETAMVSLMDAIKWDGAGTTGTIKGDDVPEVLEELWRTHKKKGV
jgi:hypothetical protein